MTEILNAKEVQTAALRAEIENLLGECTDDQNEFFHRVHNNAPWKGFANCPAAELHGNYELVRRTVMANRKAVAS